MCAIINKKITVGSSGVFILSFILTLKESLEGQMTEDNIEVGICNEAGFRRLTLTEVKDYLVSVRKK